MDRIAPERRSTLMARIRGKGTTSEMAVRRLAHRLGHRFCLHHRGLPGKPGLMFPRRRKVVFVHGYFWHQHAGCSRAHAPVSRLECWKSKLTRNAEHDRRAASELEALGWQALVILECETADVEALVEGLHGCLKTPGGT